MLEYTVNLGDIVIKFTGPEDRIIRITDRVNYRVNDKVNDKVNERERQILFLLSEDLGYTVTQLSIKTNKSRKSKRFDIFS